jgi:hypothetical protein
MRWELLDVVAYRQFNGGSGNLDGRHDPVANLPNAPAVEEECQAHYHGEPKS